MCYSSSSLATGVFVLLVLLQVLNGAAGAPAGSGGGRLPYATIQDLLKGTSPSTHHDHHDDDDDPLEVLESRRTSSSRKVGPSPARYSSSSGYGSRSSSSDFGGSALSRRILAMDQPYMGGSSRSSQGESSSETLSRHESELRDLLKKHYGYQKYNDERMVDVQKQIDAANQLRQKQIEAVLLQLEERAVSEESAGAQVASLATHLSDKFAQFEVIVKNELKDLIDVYDQRWKVERETIGLEFDTKLAALETKLAERVESLADEYHDD